MIWFYVVVIVWFRPAAFFFIYFFKSFFFLFVFFGFYSFPFAVSWWPVQWASVAFLVTWNKYDDDDDFGMQLEIAYHCSTSTTSSTETGYGPYPLLQAVWDYEISDPAVWCSAMWCGDVFVVSSSPLEGELTGFSWHLCYRPYAQCAQKGSGDVTGLFQWVWVVALASGPRRFKQIGAIWYLAAFVDTTDQKHRSSVHLSSRLPSNWTHIGR